VSSATITNTTQHLSENPVHKRKKEYIDLRRGASEHTTGIYNYFPLISCEEHLESLHCVDESYKDKQEKVRQEEVLTRLMKEAKI
jgi:hypothetical protein